MIELMTSICLVKTPVPELQDDRLDPPMGLLYLGTVLKQAGYEVKILDLSGIPEDDWEFPEADWYGFSTYTASYNRTVRIKELVEELHPDVKTVAGGPHASAMPMSTSMDFDYVIVGEGESALLELVSLGQGEAIIHGHKMSINLIPAPDYSLVDVSSYTRRYQGKPSFQIFTSRGCPYQCGFCSKLPGGHVMRRRSTGAVVREILDIRKRYGDVSFRFKDDLFASNLFSLQCLKDRDLDLQYSCNVRADYKEGLPELLAATGCKTACIGIESGSDRVLTSMNKRTSREQNLRAIKELQEVGIDVLAWLVIGYPGETWETFYETISFLEEAQPDIVRAYPLIPYPGTPVYEQVLILDEDFDHYFYIHGNNETGFVYQTPELPRSEIMGMWNTMNRYLRKFRTRVEGS